MTKTQSWEVSDELWQHVQPWYPKPRHVRHASIINGVPAAGANRWEIVKSLPALSMCYAPAASGRRCPSRLAAPAPSTNTFNAGVDRDSSWPYGRQVWPSMMKWRGLPGSGKALTEHKAKRHWRRKRWATTPPIGEKKAASAACWWTVLASRCPLSSAGPTGMMSNCWRSLWTALWSYVPKPAAVGGKTCVRTRAMRGVPPWQAMQKRGYTPHVRQARRRSSRLPEGAARPPLGGRTHALVVQPLPQAAGAL